ncbi:MAG: type 1 glutamine amidotransferase [SAR324 cluster bacterium]|nr:type 1 glutamine amidotransferase [SAR324 cluster bacterium]
MMASTLNFLIVDGYPEKSRNEFGEAGMTLAWKLYANMLHHYLPDAIYTVWLPSDHQPIPSKSTLEAYDGILWTGCNLSVYALDNPSVVNQIELAKMAYSIGIPSFGSCWGLQISVVAAGGAVEAHPNGREMGIARKIGLTPEAQNHPMYEGKSSVFEAFISHEDHVTKLPPGATLLAGNSHSRVQALDITHEKGTFWSVQYHPEYNLHEMARLIVARKERLTQMGFYASHEDAIRMVERMEELHEAPDRKDLRWQLVIDDDVLSQSVRQREFANWIKFQILTSGN